jgi:effector-binding domain-containing protein
MVELRQRGSIPVAVIRRQTRAAELSRVVPECCGLVWNAVRAQQAKAGRHVAIYWDGTIRLEVGVELLGPFVEQGDVVRSATPAGTIASVAHFGPYSGLGVAHDAIHQWCASQGHRLAGPKWEIYGHWQTEWNTNPSRIRTDVFYLIA